MTMRSESKSELAECLTAEEIALLASVFGAGQRLFVPSSTANASHFEIVIGLAATSRLIDAFGGCYAYLPGLPKPTGHARKPSLATIRTLSQTMSAPAIAERFNVSVRNIFDKQAKIRRMEEAAGRATGRKSLHLKNARARQRRVKSQDRVRLRQNAQEGLTDD